VAISDEIRAEVKEIFQKQWTNRDSEGVPEPEDVKLGNDAVNVDGTVLYADLAESTVMVDKKNAWFAAEVYKTFLISACRVIRSQGGEITAFDGDRVMAVFVGKRKNTEAVTAALNINWAVSNVVNDELKKRYPESDQVVRHSVGVDTSSLFVARTGIRGSNDLVWVGRAANYAAKMCQLRDGNFVTWITGTVHDRMSDEARFYEGKNMWEKRNWTKYDATVYRSSWWVRP
jgi:class 3 adenylate cyclase